MTSSDASSEPPESLLLTVPEASRVLRIGRQLGYQLAHEYLASGGTSVRFGRKNLRVPRWALNELAETGRVVRLCDALPAGMGRGE